MGYIEKGSLPFDINDFKSESPKSDGQPIQVIGSSTSTSLPKELTDFNIDEFFKSIMPENYQQNNSNQSQQQASNSSAPLPVPPVSNDYSMNSSLYSDLPGLNNYGSQQSTVDYNQQQQSNLYRPQPPPPLPQPSQQMNPYNSNLQPRLPPPNNNSYNLRGPPNPAFNQPYNTAMHNSYHGPPAPPLPRPRYPPLPPNQNNNYNMPLAPPPLPPAFDGNLSDEYNPETWDLEMNSWSSSQQDDSFNQSIETPVSPPHFEREGINANIIEYTETGTNDNSTSDVDHRQLRLPNIPMSNLVSKDKGRALDVDHRNLISLTGSPKIGNDAQKPLQAPNMWKGDMVCIFYVYVCFTYFQK